ncbi:hypothetical protein BC831DRAFT_456159 [Entophlyctis helioformis]|nr:hypothetical protein BC831DRAFT_456159 [Entophlyctis helioformis]
MRLPKLLRASRARLDAGCPSSASPRAARVEAAHAACTTMPALVAAKAAAIQPISSVLSRLQPKISGLARLAWPATTNMASKTTFSGSNTSSGGSSSSSSSSSNSAQWMPQRRVLWNQLVFLATGLFSTLGSQSLYYRGAADARSMLTILTTYLGMALVFLIPPSEHKQPKYQQHQQQQQQLPSSRSRVRNHDLADNPAHSTVLWLSALDVLGSLALTIGLFLVGSGIYQVVYSSVIVFTAIFNLLLMRRSLAVGQWAAILVISGGLCVSAVGSIGWADEPRFVRLDNPMPTPLSNASLSASSMSMAHLGNATSAQSGSSSGGMPQSLNAATPLPLNTRHNNMGLGFVATLIGTSIYALLYSLNDYYLTSSPTRISPRAQCTWVGLYATVMVLIIMVPVSLPTIASLPLSDPSVLASYAALTLASLYHNLSYFELIASTGAVATGVVQALRAVLVFALSHLLFCDTDADQCFTSAKGVAACVVVCGVLWFAVEKGRADRPPVRHSPMYSRRVSSSSSSFSFPSSFSSSFSSIDKQIP